MEGRFLRQPALPLPVMAANENQACLDSKLGCDILKHFKLAYF